MQTTMTHLPPVLRPAEKVVHLRTWNQAGVETPHTWNQVGLATTQKTTVAKSLKSLPAVVVGAVHPQ